MIIVCGCAIALPEIWAAIELRFSLQPMSADFAWGRDVFGFALALQNLLWGLGRPWRADDADRFGILRVMVIGALMPVGCC